MVQTIYDIIKIHVGALKVESAEIKELNLLFN